MISINSIMNKVRGWFRGPESPQGEKEEEATRGAAFSESKALVNEVFRSEKEAGESEERPKRRRSRGQGRSKSSSSGRKRASAPASAEGAPPLAEAWDAALFDVPQEEGKVRFHDLDLPSELMRAIHDLGFQYCTPIQASLLPDTLKGVDAVGKAQTGTGKSAVFLITILTHFLRKPAPEDHRPGAPRALILAPTRELALQIVKDAKALSKYMRASIVTVYGGMGYERQKKQLSDRPTDMVVATPGRLLDYMRQKEVDLSKVEILIIDEADRMLDMGFIPDVQRIVHGTPAKAQRQTMFFSATLSPDVTRLASQWTRNPLNVEIEPEQVAVNTVDQMVYITTSDEKFPLLYNLITGQNLDRVIVFTNRRDQARRLTDRFKRYEISSALLSGEVAQNRRIKTLEDFREGKIRVLVATDVAARGLHVEGVSHVVNFNLPDDPEDYVHRIGRTGRAGASGISISFADEEDSFRIPAIEKFLGHEVACVHPEEELLKAPPPAPAAKPEARPARRRPQGSGSRRGGGSSRRRSPKKEADSA